MIFDLGKYIKTVNGWGFPYSGYTESANPKCTQLVRFEPLTSCEETKDLTTRPLGGGYPGKYIFIHIQVVLNWKVMFKFLINIESSAFT